MSWRFILVDNPRALASGLFYVQVNNHGITILNLIAIFKIMFCFTFVSSHNADSLMSYSVQLKNMYSYLNSSLKLSDIVRGLSL